MNSITDAQSSAVGRIRRAVADHFGIGKREIVRRSRNKTIQEARRTAMFLCRGVGLSYPEIGREFGGFDHTTVILAVRKADADHVARVRARLSVLAPTATREDLAAISDRARAAAASGDVELFTEAR